MEELVTCEGTVHSVIFQNAENGYTVLRLLTEEGEVITVVGCIPCVAPGEHLAVSGTWETHPQHGEQVRVVELERSLPEDEEEIFSYLSSGVCKGVGPATARRIVERFGPETLDVLEREPERLTTLKGITARKAQEIAENYRQHMGLRRLMAFLAQYQLPPVLAMELRRQYGDAALEKVRENPYLLSGEACGVAFSVTDEMAMGMGMAADSDQRLQAAVTFELSHNENNGHVFLPRQKLIAATAMLLDCGTDLVEQALDSLIDRGGVVQEQVANVEACYLRRLWEAESSACIRLAGLLAADTDQSRQADREGYPEVAEAYKRIAFEEAEHAGLVFHPVGIGPVFIDIPVIVDYRHYTVEFVQGLVEPHIDPPVATVGTHDFNIVEIAFIELGPQVENRLFPLLPRIAVLGIVGHEVHLVAQVELLDAGKSFLLDQMLDHRGNCRGIPGIVELNRIFGHIDRDSLLPVGIHRFPPLTQKHIDMIVFTELELAIQVIHIPARVGIPAGIDLGGVHVLPKQ